MSKEKFIYNKQTLRYEKVTESLRTKVFRVLGFLSAVIVTAVILIAVAYTYFPSPKEKALDRELDQMRRQYLALNDQVDDMNKVLNNIQERDAGVHRMMFGMDPIDESLWNGGIGGHNPYSDFSNLKHSGKLVKNTYSRIEKLKRQMAVQSISLDTIETLARNRETMLASIPAIKPIRSDRLKRDVRLLSGFGMRIHPVYKVPKMHKGIDFTAPPGTPINATGDGKVIEVTRKRTGYGYHVMIDHGYGYQTLYAHMSRIDVKEGQQVKKGQEIGHVGNTGTSTAPHLHYEVHVNGRAIDPINFCLDDLTPEEYQMLVNLAATPNQSFD
jgi:hypothetical protein